MNVYKSVTGDTLDLICYLYYGVANNYVLEQVYSANPQLSREPIKLNVGTEVVLPTIDNPTINTKQKPSLWN